MISKKTYSLVVVSLNKSAHFNIYIHIKYMYIFVQQYMLYHIVFYIYTYIFVELSDFLFGKEMSFFRKANRILN